MIRSLFFLLGVAMLASCSTTPGKDWGSTDPLEQMVEPRHGGPELHGEMGINTQVGF
ncbi:hypothetical protein KBB96_12005 [Luteolibacter ambystomatis]|uniref:Lipoprotein n=1 Tax=Luteolibacter ambystomatis TaxID=2824561 RepID=A0A975G6D0_9BACT|nr:hypothetical protein [Luteolibacter ambystomatis]QUE49596.1 hypothetical protein KBB96_12005 [Luteolibacter ambystomatis]